MTFKALKMVPTAMITGFATMAAAQDVDPNIDVNADGMYSFPEVQAVLPEMTEDTFGVLDTTGDGLLDADEIAVGIEAGVLPPMDG